MKPMAFFSMKLALLVLTVTLGGCKGISEPTAQPVPSRDGGSPTLRNLSRLWSLEGMEATQSLLTSNTTGNTFLAVKQTGEHTWDLCGIDVRLGSVKWCSSLAQRADIALSAITNKALVHAPSGDVSAYEIKPDVWPGG